MKKNVLLLIFLYASLLSYSQEEYVSDASLLSDSINSILSDYSDFVSEDMKEEILLLMNSKEPLTYRKIFEITSNEFISKTILEKLNDKEKIFSITGGVFSDSLISSDVKTFGRQVYSYKGFKQFALIEKDKGEKNYYDNLKGGMSYSGIMAGNYRIKTGRGLFSDYSDYFSIGDAPFFSDRCELNATYDEYPAYLGCALSRILKTIAITGFASCDFYDSRVDSSGEVIEILKYNVHDDSLSSSRNNNLKALTAGTVLRYKEQSVNLAFSYTKFSRNLIENSGSNLYVFSVFGKKSIFSYDIAYSCRNGYALSMGLKKNIKSAVFNSGLLINAKFYNPHAKAFVEKDSYISGFAEISAKHPLRLKDKIEFTYKEKTKIENRVDISLMKNIDASFKTQISDKTENTVTIVFKGYVGEFASIKNSYSMKSSGTYTARADLMVMSTIIKSYIFAYYCNVAEEDMVTAYGYSIESVYPLHTYHFGESFMAGILFENSNSSKLNYNFIFSYDSSSRLKSGISITINFF